MILAVGCQGCALMVIENASQTGAGRGRRPRNLWPFIIVLMTIIGVLGGRLIAQH